MSSFSSFYKKWKMKELKVEVPSPASLNKKFSTVQQVPVSFNFPKSAFSADGRKKTVTKKMPLNSKNFSSVSGAEKDLIASYLGNSIRDSSKKVYFPYWRKFTEFCSARDFSLNSAESISLFLISLAESSKSKSGALMAKAAIKFHLKLENPSKKAQTDSFLVSKIAKSITKKYAKPVKKAATLSSMNIKAVVVSLLKSGKFIDERTAVFLLIQFLLFARFEEVASLEKSNVVFLDSGHIQVHIPRAKNYDVWDSKTSLISSGKKFDPVSIIRTYVAKLVDTNLLFPNFTKGKKEAIIFKPSHVSYDNMLKLMRGALTRIGLDGKSFSLHSPRTGALSESANSNIDHQILQRHARWKSSQMVNHYHQLSTEKKLAASRSLALYD